MAFCRVGGHFRLLAGIIIRPEAAGEGKKHEKDPF